MAVTSHSPDPALANTRGSRAIEQFLQVVEERRGLTVLDLGGANQTNILQLTAMGHRLSNEDLILSLDAYLSDPEVSQNPDNPLLVEDFFDQTLGREDYAFDAALVWDILQFLPPYMLNPMISRLHRILRPGAPVVALFHAEEKAPEVQLYSYRIHDSKTLTLVPRGLRSRHHFFNNRGFERLFQGFGSIKFFLTRDTLREVIIRR